MFKNFQLIQGRIYAFVFVFSILSVNLSNAVFCQNRSKPLIIDHTCIDIDKIPASWIEKAKTDFKLHYAHTSHGKQIISIGVEQVATPLLKVATGEGYLPNVSDALNVYEESDARENDYWRKRSSIPALDNNPNLNISMWSWCTQMNDYSQAKTQEYLNQMEALEQKYPNVTFIYMTGNAQAWHGHHQYNSDSDGYNRYLRNEQIRQYAREHNKILFDFGDIDTWCNGDQDFSSYNGNTFPREHDHYNRSEVAHTTYENCANKGKAFWWMMAKLAGWDEDSDLTATITASVKSGNVPLEVTFSGSASGGTAPYSYSWDFGDGSTSNQQNPSHTYTQISIYIVTLMVLDNNGNNASETIRINVTDPSNVLSIIDIKFTHSGQSQELTQIQRDTWYELYIYFNTPNEWSEISFADLWLNGPSYTEGSIENRGGVFHASCNYIISFSIASDRIWPRQTEGSNNGTNVTGTLGLYVDDRNHEYQINSTEGWVKVRMKLLTEAETGEWSVNAYVRNRDGVNSSLYRETIYLEDTNPVELALFEAFVKNQAVQLTWQTASETDNFGFEIERGFDKMQFRKIGFVKGHGTVNLKQNYQFLDQTVKEGIIYYYRLKQLDLDGTYKYSPIIKISLHTTKLFKLQQNYPNPFNPSTEICYSLAYYTDVDLAIFNMLGQRIITLVQEKQPSGQWRVKWNGQDKNGMDVSSGLYFYKLKAGKFLSMKKMFLLR